jgi:uncharacterized protein (TIGR02145 family)
MKMTSIIITISAMQYLAGCQGSSSTKTSNQPNAFVSIIDDRDGQSYRVAEIGDRKWIAQNMNYGGIPKGSFCYNNDVENCITYGRLYTYESALLACPAGFRLPDSAEWNSLFDITNSIEGAARLKSKSGWMIQKGTMKEGNGNDSVGFNILPAGILIERYEEDTSHFYDLGNYAAFWIGGHDSLAVSVGNSDKYNFTEFPKSYLVTNPNTDALSARCINEK